MAELSTLIKAELENIDEFLNEIPPSSKLPNLTILELAGVSALIHSFYNGIENILKQIFKSFQIKIPAGHSWHKELLEIAEEKKIISEECKNILGEYLAFRHLFIHTYAMDLYSDKMEPLVDNLQNAYSLFKKEIKIYL